MPRALVVEILGNAKQFGAELDRAAGKTRQMSRVAGVAGLAIAGGLAVGLDKSVKAAVEMQTQTARMDAAFKAAGVNVNAYSGRIDKAESSARNLGFSNIDVRDSLGTLVTATKDGKSAITDLSTAEDFARVKHMNLQSASETLAKAMTGQARAVKSLGLNIIPVHIAQDKLKSKTDYATLSQYEAAKASAVLADKQATAKQIIDKVAAATHGQAAAFAGTAEGGMARFHAQLESLSENLGNAVLPLLTRGTSVLANLGAKLSEHAGIVKIAVAALAGLAAILLTVSIATKIATAVSTLYNAALKIGAIASKAFAAAQWLVNAAMEANPIVLVATALVALGAAFYLAWTKSKTFREIVLGVWNDVKTTTRTFVDFFTSTVPQAFERVKTRITGALGEAKSWVRQHWPEIATLLSGPFAPIVALATGAFGLRAKLSAAFNEIKGDARGFGSGLASALGSGAKAAVDAVAAAINFLIRGIDAIHIPAVGFSIFGHHVGFPGWGGFNIPQIPMLAEGGVAMNPTLALIGERGPEAVIPLDRAGVGGGSSSVTVHVGPVYGTVDAAFARTLAPALATQLRNGGVPQLQQAIKAL